MRRRPSYTIDHLRRIGDARNRDVDFDTRRVTIDDNDARDLVAYIDSLENPSADDGVAWCGHARADAVGHCLTETCSNYYGSPH
jgi:hypothetical protein